MKLLCDANLSPRTVAALGRLGHDAVRSTDRLRGSAPDEDVIRVALGEERVVVTFDSDLPTLVALSGARRPSVIHLRTTSASPDHVTSVLAAALRDVADRLELGAIVVVEDERTRVRALPVDLIVT